MLLQRMLIKMNPFSSAIFTWFLGLFLGCMFGVFIICAHDSCSNIGFLILFIMNIFGISCFIGISQR